MITNPALQILSSFEKLRMPETKAEPKGMGMMTRSRPPMQDMDQEKIPMMKARERQLHIRNANKAKKNGESDGTIV